MNPLKDKAPRPHGLDHLQLALLLGLALHRSTWAGRSDEHWDTAATAGGPSLVTRLDVLPPLPRGYWALQNSSVASKAGKQRYWIKRRARKLSDVSYYLVQMTEADDRETPDLLLAAWATFKLRATRTTDTSIASMELRRDQRGHILFLVA